MKSFLAVLLLAVSLPTAPAHALCAVAYVGDTFHSVDAKGAVLVTAREGERKGIEKPVFRVDGKEAAFDKVDLAPGLVAYRLPAGATSGEIDGGQAGVAKVVAMDPKKPTLPAPKLKTLVVETTMGHRGSMVVATATLDGEPPDDAIAIVVTDAKGKALSWRTVSASSAQIVMSRGRCGVLPNGTVQPSGTVKVFWVDVNGRASPASKAVKVIEKITRVDAR